MIIAIANEHAASARTWIESNLAVLRARSGRKVCLIDTDPKRPILNWSRQRAAAGVRPYLPARTLANTAPAKELATLRTDYNDVLISAEARDTARSRAALAGAMVLLVPVQADQIDLASQYRLMARIQAARSANPSLRVVFVIVCGDNDPVPTEVASVRAYVSRVGEATLADIVLHAPPGLDYGEGRCVSDAETCDPLIAAELHALYQEVYRTCRG